MVNRRADDPESDRGSDFVRSLERGLAVIRCFDGADPELTLSEVARRTDMSRATARRLLLTLVELGYVRLNGRRFSLRPSILSLGYAYLSSLGLSDVVQPHLEELVAAVQESSSVSVLDETDIVYVARVPTKRIMNVAISIGTRFPAHATSMGRVLLAYQPESWLERYLKSVELRPLTEHTIVSVVELRRKLDQVRSDGWALVDQELEEGLRSVAVPIRNGSGRVVAAVNISVSARVGGVDEVRERMLPALRAAVGRIESDLREGAHIFLPGSAR